MQPARLHLVGGRENDGRSHFKSFDKSISALEQLWRAKVVGISTDGSSAMTGWSAGLASRVVEIALALCYRVCCLSHQFSLASKAAGQAMVKNGGIDFDRSRLLAGRHAAPAGYLVEAMGRKCDRFHEVLWGSIWTVVAWLKELKRNKDLVSWLADRNMGFSTPISKGGSVLWMQIWLLALELEPALTVVADRFVRIQGREATVADVMSVYWDISAQLKTLAQVAELVDGETPPVGAIVLH
jgi:hypothetical protein